MTPERWRRLDDLFAHAAELPAAARAGFAADACGADAELCSLLRSADDCWRARAIPTSFGRARATILSARAETACAGR